MVVYSSKNFEKPLEIENSLKFVTLCLYSKKIFLQHKKGQDSTKQR